MDMDMPKDDEDPISYEYFAISVSQNSSIHLELYFKFRKVAYSAIVANQLVAISSVFTGVVSRKHLDGLDLQVVWRHCSQLRMSNISQLVKKSLRNGDRKGSYFHRCGILR